MNKSKEFVLTLKWECEQCGWICVIDAPGFAGDGKFHYINGRWACGPLKAIKI